MITDIDNVIESVMRKEIIEGDGFESAILTAFDKKDYFKDNYSIIKKIIATIIALATLSAGVVFAKDIVKFINNIFNPQTIGEGVIEMANNGYIQDTNVEVTDNNMLVKIDEVLMDDYNLDMVFEICNTKINNQFNNIQIPDLIISDENNNIIFCDYDNVKGYEEFCKEHNIEYSNKNMHNNLTDGGYQTEVIEITENSIKFLYKMYSSGYPKSKKLTLNFKHIEDKKLNMKLEGNWNIEIDLLDKIYNRDAWIYSVQDNNENSKNIILEEAKGSVTEMHIKLTLKQIREKYGPTMEEIDKLFEDNSMFIDIIPTLENEQGKIFERSISSSDNNGGSSRNPDGDVTLDLTFPITKDDYTKTLKLKLKDKDKVYILNLGR